MCVYMRVSQTHTHTITQYYFSELPEVKLQVSWNFTSRYFSVYFLRIEMFFYIIRGQLSISVGTLFYQSPFVFQFCRLTQQHFFSNTEASLGCIYSRSPTYEPSSCKFSKMRTCVPSTSGVSEIAACPPSPIADDPSALPSPTSSPSSSQ